MRTPSRLSHLARRALGSVSDAEPRPGGLDRARGILLPGEFEAWSRMQGRDKRHSLEVLDRFLLLLPTASRAEQAAALLHDVGKSISRLGWLSRIAATLVGGVTSRFRDYRDHERLGVEMLTGVSEPRTLSLLASNDVDGVSELLRRADDI